MNQYSENEDEKIIDDLLDWLIDLIEFCHRDRWYVKKVKRTRETILVRSKRKPPGAFQFKIVFDNGIVANHKIDSLFHGPESWKDKSVDFIEETMMSCIWIAQQYVRAFNTTKSQKQILRAIIAGVQSL